MYLLLLLPLLLIGGGVGVVARKAEDENQEGGGDQGPPLGLGNTDLPPGEEKRKHRWPPPAQVSAP